MLEKIEIKNFQSHQATNLQLSPNVNTLQGNSDCGKSAVMRALSWLVFNPAGDYFISDWAKRGKTITAPCEVTLFVNGHKVTRKRDKDFNGYILDGQVFEATRNSVPPQVLSVLGLGEVNVQKQLDPPFLLSMSAGDVSRYINSLVNLTRIDKWTTAVNGRTRSLQQQVDNGKERVERSQAEVDSYSYVEKLEEVSKKMTEIENKVASLNNEGSALEDSVADWEKEHIVLNSLPDVDKVLVLLKEAEASWRKSETTASEISALKSLLQAHEEQVKAVESLPSVERVMGALQAAEEVDKKREQLFNNLVSVSSDINKRLSIFVPQVPDKLFEDIALLERWQNIKRNLKERAESLSNDLCNYGTAVNWISDSERELEPLLQKLSTMVCPLCGRTGIHEEDVEIKFAEWAEAYKIQRGN